MKCFLLIIFTLSLLLQTHAQQTKIDSLAQLLAAEKIDSNKVTFLWKLAEQYQSFKPDTTLHLAQEALELARRIKYVEGESRSLAILANSEYFLGNYPKALENYLLKLKIEEKRESPRNYASALSNIGLTYILMDDYPNALSYLYRADSAVDAGNITELKYSILVNLGEVYYRKNQHDSAGHYFERSLEIANQKNDDNFRAISLVGIANVFSKEKNFPQALKHYYDAFGYLKKVNNEDLFCESSIGIAKVYEQLNQNDSAQYFAFQSYNMAVKDGFVSRQLDAANFLTQLFTKIKNTDSAFAYLQKTVALKDTIKGQDKVRQSQMMSSDEQLRQVQLAEQKRIEKEERKQQLQLLLIGIFIPLFFLITAFISRWKIHVRFIKFLGIISLLMLFEYLTLLLHPLVAGFTHHTPFYEIIIFVAIASVLIPVHHRLEHWLINKLVVKQQPQLKTSFKMKTKRLKLKAQNPAAGNEKGQQENESDQFEHTE
ncbi:MAG: tetratricopeptide repeat protein [Ferruginibacter sp.]